jgi:hypothetical protein
MHEPLFFSAFFSPTREEGEISDFLYLGFL